MFRTGTAAAVSATRVASMPGWRVHIPTAGETVVRFACRPALSGAPWPMPRVLAELASAGATADGAARAVGSGSGAPLIHSQAFRWRGCTLHVEAHDAREVTLEMPAWDELVAVLSDEDAFWDVVDIVAAASDAVHGALGDGEAMDLDLPVDAAGWVARCRRHLGVLAPEHLTAALQPLASPYRRLSRSGLLVMLH